MRWTWLAAPDQLLAGAQQVAHRLGLGLGHEAGADQAMSEQVGEPDRSRDVGLAPRHVLDVGGIGQDQGAGVGVEDLPDRAPIDAGGLHGDVGAGVLVEPGGEVEQAGVVVAKVRTSRRTSLPSTRRMAATTVSLWTSRAAQRE